MKILIKIITLKDKRVKPGPHVWSLRLEMIIIKNILNEWRKPPATTWGFLRLNQEGSKQQKTQLSDLVQQYITNASHWHIFTEIVWNIFHWSNVQCWTVCSSKLINPLNCFCWLCCSSRSCRTTINPLSHLRTGASKMILMTSLIYDQHNWYCWAPLGTPITRQPGRFPIR